jgi:hypothetical protein
MRLVQFNCGGFKISINPQHVVTVRPSTTDKGKTNIFLVSGQIAVDGTVDEVTEKLCR